MPTKSEIIAEFREQGLCLEPKDKNGVSVEETLEMITMAGLEHHPAYYTYDQNIGCWYFGLNDRITPYYRKQIRIQAYVDIAEDWSVAGIELRNMARCYAPSWVDIPKVTFSCDLLRKGPYTFISHWIESADVLKDGVKIGTVGDGGDPLCLKLDGIDGVFYLDDEESVKSFIIWADGKTPDALAKAQERMNGNYD